MNYGRYRRRRKSGIYACRIVGPETLQSRLGKTEILLSTGSRNRPAAREASQRICAAWRRLYREFEALDRLKAIEAAPQFSGQGFLSLAEAAIAVEDDPLRIAEQLANRGRRL